MESLLPKSSSDVKENSANIPVANFVEDVEGFMKQDGNEIAGDVIKRLDERHSKYKFMEQNFIYRKDKLNVQIPDYESNLEALKFLRKKNDSKKEFETNFLLDFHVYTKAVVAPQETVFLWLGANIMLEHTIDEAENLLKENLASSRKSLQQVESDLDFLKDQITTTEVNIARVYNWDVRSRQANSKKEANK